MRSRPDPTADSFVELRRKVIHTATAKSALKTLEDNPGADLRHLDAHMQLVVEAELERARFGSVADSHYDRAWQDTTPVLAVPQRNDRIRDLLQHSLGQPEMQEAWRTWTGDHGRRSSTPDFAHAKSLMLFAAASGMGSHINALDSLFKTAGGLPEFFAVYDHQAKHYAAPPLPGALERLDVPPMRLYEFTQLREHMKRLSLPGIAVAWAANIAMLKALRDYYPTIGRAAFIDGTAYPAWKPQKWGGERGSAIDMLLRGDDDDAGYRAYVHGPTGKFDFDEKTGTFKLFRYGRIKGWRGFYWIVLVDQASGLPIIAVMQDASINEYLATGRLLDQLHELWPDIGLERLIADAGWDNAEQAEIILTKYDAQPVFRAAANIGDHAIPLDGKTKAVAVTARGEVICPHGKCAHVGMPRVPRDGLAPGESLDADGVVRVRATCPLELEREQAQRQGDNRRARDLAPQSCGKLSVRSKHHWARLGHLPHHGFGRPDLFAERQVLIARLTQVESFMNRIKSLGLANPGTARARMKQLVEHECYMALGSATLTAITLADQRQRRGITFHAEPSGRGPTPPSEHTAPLDDSRPITIAVGDDAAAPRRPKLRLIPGGRA